MNNTELKFNWLYFLRRGLSDLWFILFAGLGLILLISLFSYSVSDPAWSTSGTPNQVTKNFLGGLGAKISDVLLSFLGYASYFIPFGLFIIAWQLVKQKIDLETIFWKVFGVFVIAISGACLFTFYFHNEINSIAQTGGGLLGQKVGFFFIKNFPISFIMGVYFLFFLAGLTILFFINWLNVFHWIGYHIWRLFARAGKRADTLQQVESYRTEHLQTPSEKQQQIINRLATSNQRPQDFFGGQSDPNSWHNPDLNTFGANLGSFSPSVSGVNPPPPPPTENGMTWTSHQLNQASIPITPKSAPEPVMTPPPVAPMPNWNSFQPPPEPVSPAVPPHSVWQNSGLTVPSVAVPPVVTSPPMEPVVQVTPPPIPEPPPIAPAVNWSIPPQLPPEPEEEPIINWSAPTTQSWRDYKASKSASESGVKPTAEPVTNTTHIEVQSLQVEQLTINTVERPTLKLTANEPPSNEELADKIPDDFPEDSLNTVQQEEKIRVRLKNHLPPELSVYQDKTIIANPVLPPLGLLENRPHEINVYSDDELEQMAKTIEEALFNYRLQVQVVGINQGPVITQFELEPSAGIKSSQIANLDKDLARLLSVPTVRVVEVIPNKPYIGLEVPNRERKVVGLRHLLESPEYQQSKSPLPLVLGVDVTNRPVVVDLVKMPHLLVAGTTGSGKSVGINVMLASMLYKATAKDLHLILVDPKVLEMAMYRDIPHLKMPVITEMNQAESALSWAVDEMERRFNLMAGSGVRTLNDYNQNASDEAYLPYLVIVIDELADLMISTGKKVEEPIIRLAQKGRAAGIHLILATQRPTVDVITGLIKANITTRIAFQVSSKIDSRTIIDHNGAEALLGNGDMLYLPAGAPQALRVHGAYISDGEVARLGDYLRSSTPPTTQTRHLHNDPKVTPKIQQPSFGLVGEQPYDGEADPIYDEAVELVQKTGKGTAMFLHRELGIEFKRATQLIEAMKRAKIL